MFFRKYRHLDVIIALIREALKRRGVNVDNVDKFNSLGVELDIRKRLRATENGKKALEYLRENITEEKYKSMVEFFENNGEKTEQFLLLSLEQYRSSEMIDYRSVLNSLYMGIEKKG